jgi:hypothetical protein
MVQAVLLAFSSILIACGELDMFFDDNSLIKDCFGFARHEYF